jgi:multiple sugar transport system permease protein
VTLLSLVAVIPAAYAFARFEFKGDNIMLGAFLAINMVSGAVLIIPLYRVMMQLGVLNTYLAMIVPGTAFVIPTGIWLLRSYLMKIPQELEQAAWVDGASRLYTLRRVIIPIAMPGIIVVSITTFITAYAQQFLFAVTFNNKNELNPLPTGLYQFFGRTEVVWNELMAASLIGILPVMILYLVLQRYIIAGLTAGAIKQ